MQMLAACLAEEIDAATFFLCDVATYLGPAKECLVGLGGLNFSFKNKAEHPHYVESYYLLATHLEYQGG